MNHHENPFDMTGPEFAGLTFDEKWELKKQLRIRDRNRMITARRRRERESSERNYEIGFWATVLCIFLVGAYAYVFL
jgi:hypothetical protein